MFIATKTHLKAIKELRAYYLEELEKAHRETQCLRATVSLLQASTTAVPDPVPVSQAPQYTVVHLAASHYYGTLCRETVDSLIALCSKQVLHKIVPIPPQMYPLKLNESWCADCLD